jgi:hypothetical protein
MKVRTSFWITAACLGLMLSPVRATAQPVALVHSQLHQYVNTPNVTAARSGSWSDAGTWATGVVPAARARVAIPAGLVVTVDREIATAYDWVRVDGTLRFRADVNTALIVETLVAHGQLEMGTLAAPIRPDVSAKLIIRSLGAPIAHAVDPLELTRGLIGMSPVSIYGSPKREISPLAVLPSAGATSLQLDVDPTNWHVGDEILVAPTVYGHDEVVKVTSISGRTVGISPALKFTRTNVPAQPKVGPAVAYKVHVGNLTRNVVIQTDPGQAATVRFRSELQGHVMLMGGGHRIYNAAFVDTGRTTVKPVTDPLILADGRREPQLMPLCGVAEENIRGRYSLHFHNPGPDSAASHVEGVVVRVRRNMGLKIGVQNHSAHIVGRRLVSHQIDGSHLFTEEGDELGEYTNSLAVHSLGSNSEKNVQPGGSCASQKYPEIHHRRRRDMGHMGAGIWLQGNLVPLDGSIYAGHDHAGVDHSAQGLDLDSNNTFAVLVRPSILPEGLWWLMEGKWRNEPFDPNEPRLRVAWPVWILRDVQIYAIGHQKRSHKAAITPKFTTDLPSWYPRPKNIFKNILAWNVWNCIDTEYSPWGILEDFTCVAGDVKLWGQMSNYRRIGVSTFRQLQNGLGWWVYRNVRVDGFTAHKDSGLNGASESLEMLPAGSSRYEAVYTNGVPYVPLRFLANPARSVGPAEVCGDGVDNNGDGLMDEGCLPEPPHPLSPPPSRPWPSITVTPPHNLRIIR